MIYQWGYAILASSVHIDLRSVQYGLQLLEYRESPLSGAEEFELENNRGQSAFWLRIEKEYEQSLRVSHCSFR